MSRTPRNQSPTGIYHVIVRGVNRQKIFNDIEDRQKLIEKLAKFREVSGYRIFAYCLMDNHFHLLIQEQKEPLGTAIKRISSSYVLYFNKKYERVGHLFQGRFRSEVVDNDQYFFTVLRYIHQNPLKAKIEKSIANYKWSSYNEYIKEGCLVDTDYVLKLFAANPESALTQFVEFHGQSNNENCLDIEEPKLNDHMVKEIIRGQIGIDVNAIGKEAKIKQTSILRELKAIKGIDVRQISRLTGIPYSKVWRA
ncbi:MAG: transposase [Desulfitobacterium sp.]